LKRPLREIETIFEAVMDLPPNERESFLALRCGTDTVLLRDVKSLLEYADGADGFLAEVSDNVRSAARIGPYRIVREIGSGGMGTVYLASRDDGEFHQQVAIKVARWGMGNDWAAERFRYERQVLANLTHPHIARLLDGGSTSDGQPYLVMEYIEGEPLVAYCTGRQLSVPARLSLFLRICDAVAYAHRNLVVHRDIKPANVLVTAEGEPRLLDFGISKLLDASEPSDGVHAAATLPLMTPEYASPEQVRGEAVTTSTDVYSLGAVLYELLTEHRPCAIGKATPSEIRRAVCDSAPARPSAIGGRALAGDLDNIVLMALHKDPARRYSSVEQFAADVRSYLAGRPVIAREDSAAYRLRKFVARHKTGVAATLLLAITLFGGIAATAWQAKRVADQVLRAEKRFVQFRKLANAFLFDFQARIQDLKNVSEARKLVLSTGVEYIDGLSREAGDDPMFVREIARAYEKLGDLQGFRDDAALGNAREALASYSKAVTLVESLDRSGKADKPALSILSRSLCSAGTMMERVPGRMRGAKAVYERCLAVALRFSHGQRLLRREGELLTRAHHLIGDSEMCSGDSSGALERYLAIRELLEANRASIGPSSNLWLADTSRRIGRAYARAGNPAAATRSFEEAAAMLRNSDLPDHVNVRRTLLATEADLHRHTSAPHPLALATALERSYPRHPLVREDVAAVVDPASAACVQDLVLPLHRVPVGRPGK
jgi:eukaryotic-like serine/threonine-protein kinase